MVYAGTNLHTRWARENGFISTITRRSRPAVTATAWHLFGSCLAPETCRFHKPAIRHRACISQHTLRNICLCVYVCPSPMCVFAGRQNYNPREKISSKLRKQRVWLEICFLYAKLVIIKVDFFYFSSNNWNTYVSQQKCMFLFDNTRSGFGAPYGTTCSCLRSRKIFLKKIFLILVDRQKICIYMCDTIQWHTKEAGKLTHQKKHIRGGWTKNMHPN